MMTASDWSGVAASWEAHAAASRQTSATRPRRCSPPPRSSGRGRARAQRGHGRLAAHLAELSGRRARWSPATSRRRSSPCWSSGLAAAAGQRRGPSTRQRSPLRSPRELRRSGVPDGPDVRPRADPPPCARSAASCDPGGSYATAVWGAPGRRPAGWWSVGFATMMTGLLERATADRARRPVLARRPRRLEKLARDAGFADAHVEVVSYSRPLPLCRRTVRHGPRARPSDRRGPGERGSRAAGQRLNWRPRLHRAVQAGRRPIVRGTGVRAGPGGRRERSTAEASREPKAKNKEHTTMTQPAKQIVQELIRRMEEGDDAAIDQLVAGAIRRCSRARDGQQAMLTAVTVAPQQE